MIACAIKAIMRMLKRGPIWLNLDEPNARGMRRFVIVPPRIDNENPRKT